MTSFRADDKRVIYLVLLMFAVMGISEVKRVCLCRRIILCVTVYEKLE